MVNSYKLTDRIKEIINHQLSQQQSQTHIPSHREEDQKIINQIDAVRQECEQLKLRMSTQLSLQKTQEIQNHAPENIHGSGGNNNNGTIKILEKLREEIQHLNSQKMTVLDFELKFHKINERFASMEVLAHQVNVVTNELRMDTEKAIGDINENIKKLRDFLLTVNDSVDLCLFQENKWKLFATKAETEKVVKDLEGRINGLMRIQIKNQSIARIVDNKISEDEHNLSMLLQQ